MFIAQATCGVKHRGRYAQPDQYGFIRIDSLAEIASPPPLPPSSLSHRDIGVLRRYKFACVSNQMYTLCLINFHYDI